MKEPSAALVFDQHDNFPRIKLGVTVWVVSACNVNGSLCVSSSHEASHPVCKYQPLCFKEQHEERRWRQGGGGWPFI